MERILEIDEIKTAVEIVARANNIKKVDLFGSYATGNVTKESDIDLLVDFDDESLSLFDIFRVKREFEDALGKKIDLVETPIPKESFLVINKVVPMYGY